MNFLIFNGSTSFRNTNDLVKVYTGLCAEKHNVTYLEETFEDCRNCGACSYTGKCCIKDNLSHIFKYKDFDVIVIATPVYFFGMSSKAKAFLDRLYFLEKSNLIFSLIAVSGSEYEESGVDLIRQSLVMTCNYCDSYLTRMVHKVTNDLYKHIEDKDIKNLKSLLKETEELYYEIKKDKRKG